MDHEPGKLQVCKSPKIKDLVGETTKIVCRSLAYFDVMESLLHD